MISEITKRNIFDELKIRNTNWSGRLDEVEFLNRLFDIESLPTTDGRFQNMRGDIWQHRINNNDWDNWWIISDTRLNLMSDDNTFLRFITEIIHPVVRNDAKEVSELLNVFNGHLAADGWKLVEKTRISNKPIYVAVEFKNDFEFRNEEEVSEKYAGDQLKKCTDKIVRNDYEGAVSSARAFIEGVFFDIYKRITGEKMPQSGDLPDKYKLIKNLLKLSQEQSPDKSFKSICDGFSKIVHAIDNLSNSIGDRHVPSTKPELYEVEFCINSAKIMADFLYGRLQREYQGKENLFEGLIAVLDSDNKRALSGDELRADPAIAAILEKCDEYIISLLKDKFIEDYQIDSFKQNDIFFAGMRIFFDELSKSYFEKIYNKCKNNNQTLPPYGGLKYFMNDVLQKKPDYLSKVHDDFLEVKKPKIEIPF